MPITAKGHILVIAPDIDLRRSLEFALEAEGYAVAARPQIDVALLSAGARFDCTVLDHGAVVAPPSALIDFCVRAQPIVLLSNSAILWLSEWIAVTVEKPTPGGALSAAIQSAMLSRSVADVP